MDWRDNQFGRKKLRRMDETQTEFDLLVQGTIREITLRDKLRKSIRLLEGTPISPKKISGWGTKFRDLGNFGKDFFFRQRF